MMLPCGEMNVDVIITLSVSSSLASPKLLLPLFLCPLPAFAILKMFIEFGPEKGSLVERESEREREGGGER